MTESTRTTAAPPDAPRSPAIAANRLVDEGTALHRAGRLAEAETRYRQALELDPSNSGALHLLGLAAHQAGEHARGLALIDRAIALADKVAAFHCNRGIVLKSMRRFAEAVESYDRAIALQPDYVEAMSYRGNALMAMGRRREALESYDRAIAARPDDPGPHFNRGVVLRAMFRPEAALASYDRAVELKPDWPELHVNRGNVLKDLDRLDDAVAACREAIRLRPQLAEAHSNLGTALARIGFHDEAMECFRIAQELAPPAERPRLPLLMTLIARDDETPERIAQAHREMGRVMARSHPPPRSHPPLDLGAGRKLRVGYVSPDLHTHSVAYFLEGVLAAHDRGAFEIACYHCGTMSDATTARMRASVDLWRNVEPLDDDELATRIVADRIDILVDLAGHTKDNRLGVFQRKPAPIQATWIGYPDTTGLETIDYRITDAIADPPGDADRMHTERLWRLPRGFLCYRPPEDAPGVPARPCATPGARGIAFGSFNNLSKFAPGVIDSWSRILTHLPDARLVLKASGLGSDSARQRVLERFAGHGIGPERIETMAPTPTRKEHLDLYRHIDIALDTFPYNGTTTTCEALWMGVPVVTFSGDRHAARVGASLLHRVGLDGLVARDVEGYVEIACALAADRRRILDLGAGLRQRMRASPLCDARTFARDLEDAYRAMARDASAHAGRASAKDDPAASRLVDEGAALHREGRRAEAETLYRRALELDPEHPGALHLLGLVAHQGGDHARGLALIDRAIARADRIAAFHCNRGVVLKAMRRFAEAVTSYDRAIALRPDHAEPLVYRANALMALGRHREALASYDSAIVLKPDDPGLHFSRGRAADAVKDPRAALASYERAIAIRPGWAEAHVKRGNAIKALGDLDSALTSYRRALDLGFESTDLHFNRGNAFYRLQRYGEAAESFRDTIRLDPKHAFGHRNLGVALARLGFNDESLACFRTAIGLLPPSEHHRIPWLMTLTGREDARPEDIARAHRELGQTMARSMPAPRRHPPLALEHGRRLRVGYVSPDFHTHSVAYFFEGVLAAHDRGAFEIACYDCGTIADATTARMRASAQIWREVASLDDDALAARILADRIDILVDLAGHTRDNRLGVFQRKPAPVQATWIGYPNTTGLGTIDYRITDAVADPPGVADELHTERLVRLARGFLCYRPPGDAPAVQPRPCARPDAPAIAFGSFNNLSKLGHGVVDAWSRILARIPGATLVLKASGLGSEAARRRVQDRFASRDIDPIRIRTIPATPTRNAHLDFYRHVDIGLDTFPYNGTTTTCEALWMGVPVITFAGDRHAARVGASLLHRVGLDELVAKDVEGYVDIACALAGDSRRVATLGTGLRDRMRASPLCDARAFTRDLEDAYRGMARAAAGSGGS